MTGCSIHPSLVKYKTMPIGYAQITVPFHDIDIMEVAWHGHYAKYFEIARCAVLKLIDYDYEQMRDSGFMWPIVDSRIRYVSPAVYDDRLVVAAVIVEWELRLVIKYFVIHHENKKVLTKGQTVQVPLDGETKALCFGRPEILDSKIDAWRRSVDTGNE